MRGQTVFEFYLKNFNSCFKLEIVYEFNFITTIKYNKLNLNQ